MCDFDGQTYSYTVHTVPSVSMRSQIDYRHGLNPVLHQKETFKIAIKKMFLYSGTWLNLCLGNGALLLSLGSELINSKN